MMFLNEYPEYADSYADSVTWILKRNQPDWERVELFSVLICHLFVDTVVFIRSRQCHRFIVNSKDILINDKNVSGYFELPSIIRHSFTPENTTRTHVTKDWCDNNIEIKSVKCVCVWIGRELEKGNRKEGERFEYTFESLRSLEKLKKSARTLSDRKERWCKWCDNKCKDNICIVVTTETACNRR